MIKTKNVSEALGRAGDAVGGLVALPVRALVDTITLNQPLQTINDQTRSSVSDILWAPGRVLWHSATGITNGVWKMLGGTVKNAPVVPA